MPVSQLAKSLVRPGFPPSCFARGPPHDTTTLELRVSDVCLARERTGTMANKTCFYPSGAAQTVEFGAQTKCLYLEVLACPVCKAPQRLEGMLDDSSLKKWLDEVYAPDRYLINSHKLTINPQQDTFSPGPLAKEHLSDRRCSRMRIL
jgi:hypothetical protein